MNEKETLRGRVVGGERKQRRDWSRASRGVDHKRQRSWAVEIKMGGTKGMREGCVINGLSLCVDLKDSCPLFRVCSCSCIFIFSFHVAED